MNESSLRHIIREYLTSMLIEQDIETSLFSPAEEKFLATFVKLESNSLYSKKDDLNYFRYI